MSVPSARWLLAAAITAAVVTSAPGGATAHTSRVTVAGATADLLAWQPAAPSSDPWGFDDEKTVETWGDVVRPQAWNLAGLVAFFALALGSFFSRRTWLKYVTLVAAIGYMGFAKSYLISIVNVFALVQWDLPQLRFSLGWYLLTIFAVVSTILWGRLYCSRMCAFGALTQLMDVVLPAKLRIQVPRSIERRATWIKYGLLVAVVAYYLATKDLLVYRYVEPFWMFGLFGTPPLWIAVAVLLLATVFVRNLYCRFLCPVGAALGLLSNLTIWRIKRWSECQTCKICEKACEWGANRGPNIDAMECMRCDDCEMLYADTQKCPHWIVIKRKSDYAAPTAL